MKDRRGIFIVFRYDRGHIVSDRAPTNWNCVKALEPRIDELLVPDSSLVDCLLQEYPSWRLHKSIWRFGLP